jgi:hypothetical protein
LVAWWHWAGLELGVAAAHSDLAGSMVAADYGQRCRRRGTPAPHCTFEAGTFEQLRRLAQGASLVDCCAHPMLRLVTVTGKGENPSQPDPGGELDLGARC